MEQGTGRKEKGRTPRYKWLIGSLCIWLLCAWVAQQPGPKKAALKTRPARTRSSVGVRASAKATAPVATTLLNANGVMVDAESGLAIDETMPTVKGQCMACHSSKLILQSHFDRDKWVERIRWMQRTQKLWDLGETEKPILDYLVKHYGPLDTPFDGRRLPLSPPRWHTR